MSEMVSPSKLCSVCFDMLQPRLEAVENSLHTDFQHHSTFSSFKQAVEGGCFICTKLWDSVEDASIDGWSNEPGSWVPFG
ncbi:Protein indc11 [Fusarium oxysporum f. sp. albedinis]|nr:Protein indc11 [Fusarium oxysporum f. sp. albedinis]